MISRRRFGETIGVVRGEVEGLEGNLDVINAYYNLVRGG
jgi:hypothetical protein